MTGSNVRERRRRAATAVVEVDRPREIRRSPQPRRRPRRNWRGFLSATSLLVLLSALCSAFVLALQSPRFALADVTIDGAGGPLANQIAGLIASGCTAVPAAPAAPAATSSTRATCTGPHEPSIFLINSQRIAARLQTLPAVRSAHVRVALPNHLWVTVQRRHAEAAWVVGPTVYQVAADGTIIGQGSPAGLKVVVGDISGKPVKVGGHIDVNLIQAAKELHDRLPADLGIPVDRIEYSPTEGLAVIGNQNLIAIFGSPTDLGLKMAELQRIIELAKDKHTTLGFVDLRYKTPYYRAR
ncbi:MAG: cell division protein FtsQ/DivIB [Chloroflexota bacterium]